MSNLVDKLKSIGSWLWEHKLVTAIIGVLIIFITLGASASAYQKHKQQMEKAGSTGVVKKKSQQSDYDKNQMALIQKYGQPKKGFRWTDDGQLQAIGSTGKSPEDVIYTYVRGLSTLDFANAQRYSYKTQVVKQYQQFYSSDTQFSYNQNFKKGMYTQVLLSIKPNKVVSTVTFADYKQVVTMNISMLDLSNKDFWLKDKDQLFEQLKKYKQSEGDTTKMKQFLYNYVLKYYQSPKAKTTNMNVSFTLEQTMDNTWLVTNDTDLDAIAQYQDGETVVDEILNEFDTWLSGQDTSNSGSSNSTSTSDEVTSGSGSSDEISSRADDGSFDNSGVVDYSKDGAGANDGVSNKTTGQ